LRILSQHLEKCQRIVYYFSDRNLLT